MCKKYGNGNDRFCKISRPAFVKTQKTYLE